jgi:hypothetical protein
MLLSREYVEEANVPAIGGVGNSQGHQPGVRWVTSPGFPLYPTPRMGRILGSVGLPRPGRWDLGRRGIKEYRPGEALSLIALDREGKTLVCPSCGAAKVLRTPKRTAPAEAGRVTLHCDACGRNASYLSKTDMPPPERTPVKH